MGIKRFVNRYNIKCDCELVEQNPNAPDWTDANHFKCVLKMGRKRMTVYFSQGYGVSGEPGADNILDCLASDCASVENVTFEEWCSDLGYDPDSRKAERIYKACQQQAKKLRQFLGDELYKTLLWDVERL